MAGVNWAVNQAAISLTAATTKTVAQIIAASNVRNRIRKATVTVYGAADGTANAKVDLCRQSSDGTLSSATVSKTNESDAETLQVSAKHTATVEPGTNTVLDTKYCSSIQGTAEFFYPLGDQYVKGGSITGIRVTCPANASCTVRIEGEE